MPNSYVVSSVTVPNYSGGIDSSTSIHIHWLSCSACILAAVACWCNAPLTSAHGCNVWAYSVLARSSSCLVVAAICSADWEAYSMPVMRGTMAAVSWPQISLTSLHRVATLTCNHPFAVRLAPVLVDAVWGSYEECLWHQEMECRRINAWESLNIRVLSATVFRSTCTLLTDATLSIAWYSASLDIFAAIYSTRVLRQQNFQCAQHKTTIPLVGPSTMLSLPEFSTLGHQRLLFHTIPSFTYTFVRSFVPHSPNKQSQTTSTQNCSSYGHFCYYLCSLIGGDSQSSACKIVLLLVLCSPALPLLLEGSETKCGGLTSLAPALVLGGSWWCRPVVELAVGGLQMRRRSKRNPKGDGRRPRQKQAHTPVHKTDMAARCDIKSATTKIECNTMSTAFQTNINRIPESFRATQSWPHPK